MAQNVLLCNKDTTNEEITSFLYRALLYKSKNSCFIIGGIELLENNQKECFLNILNHFFPKGNESIESCLIILYINNNTDIFKSLEMKRYRKILDISRELYQSEKYTDKNIEIIKSDKSGVGKSTQIKREIMMNKKKWIYFPFGGVFTRQDIIKRLKEIKIDNDSVLHLDLYNTDQINLMMEFLFSILIMRFYGQNEDIFYLSNNIQIKVEIPNTFIDFFEKFPILSLFNIREMKIGELPPLIVPKELDSNIQIVAIYLKALKEDKINNYDLIFPNITPVDFSTRTYQYKKKICTTCLKPESLSAKDCQQLIFDTIKEEIPNPTYYQITSFINVLAVQLKNLNRNFYLNAYQLIISNKINELKLRTFIVKSFIKLTNHFTKGAFTKLLKGKENEHKSSLLFGQYNENKDLNNAVNNLAKNVENIISFDSLDPSLFFFHEGDGEFFSILTNKNKNDQEYKDLLSLKNSQIELKEHMFKELPNYKIYTQKQFLEELQLILNVKNPALKGTSSSYKSLEEIAGNYVFTADNFCKMVLILLRIRSNIPVIMMGETGCGKTSLIRKLSEMKNNGNADKMKILNIHAGTTEQDIIDFIEKKVIDDAKFIEELDKEEKERRINAQEFYEETKLWVFLDEINTCKSMGLISELMCKHTCQGKPLPSNIVFIAACNPYRERENKGNNNENKIGLDIRKAYKQLLYLNPKELEEIKCTKNSNLVYTVNPLPHSLLNFVFDFGNLTPQDEKNYIKYIIKDAITINQGIRTHYFLIKTQNFESD